MSETNLKQEPKKIAVYYDPSLENPPRDGKTIINGITFNPRKVTVLTQEELDKVKAEHHGKLLFELNALRVMPQGSRLQKTTIANLPADKAREMIHSENNIMQLKEWQKTEFRPDIRKEILIRINEINSLANDYGG